MFCFGAKWTGTLLYPCAEISAVDWALPGCGVFCSSCWCGDFRRGRWSWLTSGSGFMFLFWSGGRASLWSFQSNFPCFVVPLTVWRGHSSCKIVWFRYLGNLSFTLMIFKNIELNKATSSVICSVYWLHYVTLYRRKIWFLVMFSQYNINHLNMPHLLHNLKKSNYFKCILHWHNSLFTCELIRSTYDF